MVDQFRDREGGRRKRTGRRDVEREIIPTNGQTDYVENGKEEWLREGDRHKNKGDDGVPDGTLSRIWMKHERRQFLKRAP